MRLPPDSHIAIEKLTNYLLVPQNRGDKSAWLAQLGYSLGNHELLLHDLQNQILPHEAVLLETNEYGQIFVIRGVLRGPNGKSARVRTIWMTEHLTGNTKFITLIPDKQRV